MDSQQIFHLIDSILPFEVCLYYQVLPLSLQGSRLYLGMVDPKDVSALDYVRRIVGYINCSLVPKSLESKVHSDTLSAYLKYSHSRPSSGRNTIQEKSSEEPKQKTSISLVKIHQNHQINQSNQNHQNHQNHQSNQNRQNHQNHQSNQNRQNNESALVYNPAQNLVRTEPKIAPACRLNQPPEIKLPPAAVPLPSAIAPSLRQLPVLTVNPLHLDKDLEALANLPPNQLLQELLARVLQGGIGRLYFERQLQKGRILWSQNGVLQSVLSNMSEPLFQSTLNEFKRLVNLSLIPVKEPKQVEILRSYQNANLLLRLRVMPEANGEEATLQVLRGAALKFYQQQQIVALSRDALRLAHQLEYKVSQIERTARNNPELMPRELESLPVLSQLIKKVENQVKFLRELQQKKILN